MAERKKSQAEKAAMAKKQTKTSGSKTSAAKKTTKNARKQEDTSLNIPVRLITSLVCVTLFILFLVIFLQPEGALVKLLQSFVLGLIGNVAFYVAIPALLYLFTIQAFSGKRPVILRSVCLICFTLICGLISQLGMDTTRALTPRVFSSACAFTASSTSEPEASSSISGQPPSASERI